MPDGDENSTPQEGDGSAEGTPPQRSVTQADLDRVGATEAKKGKQQGRKELLQELGFDNADEVRAFVASMRSKDDEALSEAERKLKLADEKERKADEKARAADERLLNVQIERALEVAGVPAAASPKVRKLVEGLDADSDGDVITAAVEALKLEMPQVFTASSGSPATPPPPADGQPPKPPTAPASSSDSKKQADDLLRQRHPNLVKS